MRFVLMLVVAAVVMLIGLYIYGSSLKPETRTIEQEAVSADA